MAVTAPAPGVVSSTKRPVGRGKKRFTPSSALTIALFAVMAFVLVVPIAALAVISFHDPTGGASPFYNYVEAFSSALYLEPIAITIIISFVVVLVGLLVGVPMAWLVSMTNVWGARAIRILIYGGFILPPFLSATAWVFLASPNVGWLNQISHFLFGIKPFDVYTIPALAVLMGLFLLPYTFIFAVTSFDALGGDMDEAGATLGASRFYRIRRILIPLIRPALIASVMLAFLQSVALYGAPAILAVPAGHQVVSTQLVDFFVYPPRLELAAAYSAPWIIVAAIGFYSRRKLLGRARYTAIGGKTGRRAPFKLGLWRPIATVGCWFVLTVSFLLPMGALLFMSFAESWTDLSRGLSLESFGWVFTRGRDAMINSLSFSAMAALLCVVFGFIIAYLNIRKGGRWNSTLQMVASAPVVLPGVIIAVALIAVYAGPPLALYGTGTIIVIALLVRFLPIALQNIEPGIMAVDPSLEEAGRSLGASPARTFRTILGPIISPSLASGAVLSFTAAMNELSAVILLVSFQTAVIPTLAVNLFATNHYGRLAAIGVVQVAIVLIATVALQAVVRLKSRRQSTL